jgi:hypothetical protein
MTDVAQIKGLLFQGKNIVLMFTDNGLGGTLGEVLGDFFTNASSHPECDKKLWQILIRQPFFPRFVPTYICTCI